MMMLATAGVTMITDGRYRLVYENGDFVTTHFNEREIRPFRGIIFFAKLIEFGEVWFIIRMLKENEVRDPDEECVVRMGTHFIIPGADEEIVPEFAHEK